MRGAPGPAELRKLARVLLAEDSPHGDVTTRAVVPPRLRVTASIVAEQTGVAAGLDAAVAIFHAAGAKAQKAVRDGSRFRRGKSLLRIRGTAHSVLRAERPALNVLQHLCGVATLTATFRERVRGTGVRITDTRKTLPGLRSLEKYAVRCGGGLSNRGSLSTGILIKENHLACLGGEPQAIAEAMRRASRLRFIPHIEVTSLPELRAALGAGAVAVLLDNFTPAGCRRAVRIAHGRAVLEASGGIHLGNARAYARTGIHVLSVGRLTHSAPACEMSLDLRPVR